MRGGVEGGVGEDKTGGMWGRGEGWMNPYVPKLQRQIYHTEGDTWCIQLNKTAVSCC